MSIAPIEPIDQPELPKPSPPRRRSLGLEALFGLIVAAVVVALGAPVGLLWSWIAPKVELVQTPYGPYPIEGEPEGYFADDGWFMILGAAAGILIAVAAWFILRRYRGPFILAGLVVGSAAAAALAAWLGNKIGYAHYVDLAEHAPVDTHIFRPAKVRAGEASLWHGFVPWVRGSLLIQALVAAVVYTCLAGFHTSPTLTHDPDPDVPTGDPYYIGHPDGAGPYAAHPDGVGPYAGHPDNGGPYAGPAHPVFGSLDPARPGPVYPGPAAQPGFDQPAQPWPAPAHPGYSDPGHGQPPTGASFSQPTAEGQSPAGPPPWPAPPTGTQSGTGTAGGHQPHDDPAPGRLDLRKPASGPPGAVAPSPAGQHDAAPPGASTPPSPDPT
ncbi:DUF2567 domain-containing protein [Dactylosporangium sp. NPDC049742]|uniref:DUF2567 domain-containing protein n=1 Tax=Dactylosporangium sp. NPDC049742 TaxID=3154737 RepID=UPI003412A435